jgi:hypothetical protein
VSDALTPSIMGAFYEQAFATDNAPAALADVQRRLLVRLRKEKVLDVAVRRAGAFVMTSRDPSAADYFVRPHRMKVVVPTNLLRTMVTFSVLSRNRPDSLRFAIGEFHSSGGRKRHYQVSPRAVGRE